MNLDNIPIELKQHPYWCVYGVPGLERKCPANPKTLQGRKKGGATDYMTAMSCVAFGQAEGVGFDFTDSDFVGVDLDHVRDVTTGEILPWAQEILSDFNNTYIEYSLSTKGFHIIAKGSIPKSFKNHKIDPSNKSVGLEMMGPTGFIALTGNVYNAAPVVDCSDKVLELWKKYSKKAEIFDTVGFVEGSGEPSLFDEGMQCDKKLASLWNGERQTGDESAADQALMNKLAYWDNRDAPTMIEHFLQSPHAKQKSDFHTQKLGRADYLNRTASTAIKDCTRTAAGDKKEWLIKDFAGVSAEDIINPLSDKKRYSFNDRGNGFLFADLTAKMLRYCPQAKCWYVYRAGKWEPDIGDATAREYAKKMSDYLFRFVPKTTDGEREAYIRLLAKLSRQSQ